MSPELTLKPLLGQIIAEIAFTQGEVTFTIANGKRYRMFHFQDCCESVNVEQITGKISGVIGCKVTSALEEISGNKPDDYKYDYEPESATWTKFTITTQFGALEIFWLGTSNGYYSESVSFDEITENK